MGKKTISEKGIETWLKLYPREFLTSGLVIRMSAAERGCYIMLLCNEWLSNDGLPADDRALAAFAGVTPAEWRKCKKTVLEAFVQRNGRMYNEKLQEVKAEQLGLYELAVEAGKAGAAKRWALERERKAAIEQQESDGVAIGPLMGSPPKPQWGKDAGIGFPSESVARESWNPTSEQLAAWMRNTAAKGGAIAPEDKRARRQNVQDDVHWAGKLLDLHPVKEILARGNTLVRWVAVKRPMGVSPTLRDLFQNWDVLEPDRILAEFEAGRAESGSPRPSPNFCVIDGGAENGVA